MIIQPPVPKGSFLGIFSREIKIVLIYYTSVYILYVYLCLIHSKRISFLFPMNQFSPLWG